MAKVIISDNAQQRIGRFYPRLLTGWPLLVLVILAAICLVIFNVPHVVIFIMVLLLSLLLLILVLGYKVHQLTIEHKKVKEAMAEQALYIAMIIHEIRTPLSVIDMAIESVKVLDHSGHSERLLRYSRIQSAVRRMSRLLALGNGKGLVSMLDGEAGQCLDIRKICEQIRQELSLEWRARLLICSHRNDSYSPLWIKGNETALKLALFNLVENAMKYSTDSVVIDMTVNVNRNQLIWQIKNQGPAIAERQIEQIFEPGYRAGNSGGQTGMGLGLYLARVIIQRHGGSLNYHLGAPQGSCFECCLALHHSPSTKQSKMTEED